MNDNWLQRICQGEVYLTGISLLAVIFTYPRLTFEKKGAGFFDVVTVGPFQNDGGIAFPTSLRRRRKLISSRFFAT